MRSVSVGSWIGSVTPLKRAAELSYWIYRRLKEGRLEGPHYERAFTEDVGLPRASYESKRILDVGCGPRGSLEWAYDARQRVGLDPLVPAYRRLGVDRHAMRYVGAPAERMPFPDASFDVVTCFNALDHVEDVDAVIREITRVTEIGGTLVLVTDVNHEPTRTEPQAFGWDVTACFEGWRVEDERRLERGENVYDSLHAAVEYDASDPRGRYGLLVARLIRSGDPR